MVDPDVSVIVPVYNAQDYVGQCLDSLANQTLANIEIVVVLDAPTDRSAEVVARFETDPRFRIVELVTNRGLSAARETGITQARGEFIAFVDADDWVEGSMYADLYAAAMKHNADVVCCGYQRTAADGTVTSIEPHPLFGQDLSSREKIRAALVTAHSSRWLWFVCRNIYRRSMLEGSGTRFIPELRFGEDSVFNLEAFLSADRCHVTQATPYFYRDTPGSLTTNLYNAKLEEFLQIAYTRKLDLAESHGLAEGFVTDLHLYTVRELLPRLLTNALKDPRPSSPKSAIISILAIPMVDAAVHVTRVGERSLLAGHRLRLALAKLHQPGLLARVHLRAM